MNHFAYLHGSLTSLLYSLEDIGFDPNNGYMFGFSFGARIAIQAAGNYGYQKLSKIDGKKYTKQIFFFLKKATQR